MARRLEAGLLLPLALLVVGLVLVPAVLLGGASLFTWVFAAPQGSVTLGNYAELLGDAVTWRVVWTTIQIAAPVAFFSMLGGYVIAYRIVFVADRPSRILFVLVITALMASYIVRVYAWRTLLGTRGVINGGLEALGLIEGPIDLLLFSKTAVVIAEVSLFLPLAALTLFAALSGIDPALREAARDLGAGRTQAFMRIVLPLSGPTLLVSTALIFFLACGDFITPVFVGGPESVTIGRLIADSFGISANYGRGAALSILMVIGFVIVFILLRATMRTARLLPERGA